MRLISRESAEIVTPRASSGALATSAEFRAATASSEHHAAAAMEPEYFPATEIYTVDLSVEAMQSALKEDVGDRSLPLAERTQALLTDAMVEPCTPPLRHGDGEVSTLAILLRNAEARGMLALTLKRHGRDLAATGYRDAAAEHFKMGDDPSHRVQRATRFSST